MSNNYTPRPGSLAAHACAWFKVNTGRKLTLQEICGRWGGTSQTATAQLGAAEDADFLLSERIGRSDVYSAGPGLANWTPLNDSLAEAKSFNPTADTPAAGGVFAPTPTLMARPAPAPRVSRKRLPMLDVSRIAVQTGTLVEPILGGRGAKGQSQYNPLLDKLAKPNTWVEVPSAYVASINKAVIKYRKTRPERVFRCVKVSPTTYHLQRLADKQAEAT